MSDNQVLCRDLNVIEASVDGGRDPLNRDLSAYAVLVSELESFDPGIKDVAEDQCRPAMLALEEADSHGRLLGSDAPAAADEMPSPAETPVTGRGDVKRPRLSFDHNRRDFPRFARDHVRTELNVGSCANLAEVDDDPFWRTLSGEEIDCPSVEREGGADEECTYGCRERECEPAVAPAIFRPAVLRASRSRRAG